MTEENTPANSGQNNVSVARDPPPRTDDELRRQAAETLAEHLDIGMALIERCERLAQAAKGDRLGPLNAAARLMRANAHIAQALGHVAQVESRRRSIVERIQPPVQKNGDSFQENERKNIRVVLWDKLEKIRIREAQRGQYECVDPQGEAHTRLMRESLMDNYYDDDDAGA